MKTSAAEKAKKEKTYTPALPFIPDAGVAASIGHGLHWLRTPLPFDLDHINLWLLEGPEDWTIVDSGYNFPVVTTIWDKIFTEKFARKPVKDIFITHFHPDHFGLAGWLAEQAGVTPRMTVGEWDMVQRLVEETGKMIDAYRPYYVEAGVEGSLLDTVLKRRFNYRNIVYPPPGRIDIVKTGDTLMLGGKSWEIVGGYGHCPEHACLYNAQDKIFISGDIVLPDISPNISLFPGSAENPVADYLATLDDIKKRIPDDVTVLPSHGVPFKGLHRRIEELKAHHQRRFDRMHEVMRAGPQTAFKIMEGLFAHRKLQSGDFFFALGETLAHLTYDVRLGLAVKTVTDGVALYRLP